MDPILGSMDPMDVNENTMFLAVQGIHETSRATVAFNVSRGWWDGRACLLFEICILKVCKKITSIGMM